MTRIEFEELFSKALDIAAKNAEEYFGISVPRDFRIALRNPRSETVLRVKHCLEQLYLGEDRFFRVIDLAVTKVLGGVTTVFVRPSDHPPATFPMTAHFDEGMGPFHQLISAEIEVDNGVKIPMKKL